MWLRNIFKYAINLNIDSNLQINTNQFSHLPFSWTAFNKIYNHVILMISLFIRIITCVLWTGNKSEIYLHWIFNLMHLHSIFYDECFDWMIAISEPARANAFRIYHSIHLEAETCNSMCVWVWLIIQSNQFEFRLSHASMWTLVRFLWFRIEEKE